MTKRPLANLPASVHQRLLDKARASGRPFNEMLQHYANERFLYRLSKAPQAGKFVLKGALMLSVWKSTLSRPTQDIDLLGRISNDIETVTSVMRTACQAKVQPDAMVFHADTVQGRRTADDADYEGIRIGLQGNLGNARVFVQLDVGFGDAVVPAAMDIDYPTILDFPAPKLKGYNRETTIAEKFHVMVKLGILNSRMKYFFDIWLLSRQFAFDGETLANAIGTTFRKRDSEIPLKPVAFQQQFRRDATKQTQWRAFLRKSMLTKVPVSFHEVVGAVAAFLKPVTASLAANEPFRRTWRPPGPWK